MTKEISLEDYMKKFDEAQKSKGTADVAEGGVLPSPESGDGYTIRILKPPKVVSNDIISGLGQEASLTMRVQLIEMDEKLIEKYTEIKAKKFSEKSKRKYNLSDAESQTDYQDELRDNKVKVGKEYDIWVPATLLKSIKDELVTAQVPIDNKLTCLIGRDFKIYASRFRYQGRPAKSIKARLQTVPSLPQQQPSSVKEASSKGNTAEELLSAGEF